MTNVKNEVENLEDYQWQKHLTIAKYSMALVSTDSEMRSSFQLRIVLNQVLLHTSADSFEAQTTELCIKLNGQIINL